MNEWKQIENQKNRFKLVCNHNECILSILNMINGMISISSVHKNQRHTTILSQKDMLFVVSQYLNSLSDIDRNKLLEFFKNF